MDQDILTKFTQQRMHVWRTFVIWYNLCPILLQKML